MATTLLDSGTHLCIRFSASKKRELEFYVEAQKPVSTYILDREGKDAFYDGEEPRDYSYGGFTNRKRHEQEIKLPYPGEWFLLIVNWEDNEDIAVHYEIWL
ncbi:MAG: hypothetical protein NUW37_18030 [Planctomycetes bacterium]|nr:hypothetical protein [Planctomycetota bacterium]